MRQDPSAGGGSVGVFGPGVSGFSLAFPIPRRGPCSRDFGTGKWKLEATEAKPTKGFTSGYFHLFNAKYSPHNFLPLPRGRSINLPSSFQGPKLMSPLVIKTDFRGVCHSEPRSPLLRVGNVLTHFLFNQWQKLRAMVTSTVHYLYFIWMWIKKLSPHLAFNK